MKHRGCSFVYSPQYYCDIGAHVFPTTKFRLVHEALRQDGDIPPEAFVVPAPASEADLLRVHTREYLADFIGLKRTARTDESELPLTTEIVRSYILAAGGTIQAARCALQGGLAMNLGGGFHHAFPDHAEGFCYINDVAVAVRALRSEGAIARAVVVDLDVHQGNGTAVVFEGDPSVFTFSVHQENNYPRKQQSNLDIGLEDGATDADYLSLLEQHLPAILDAFKPQLALYVAGVDVYREDQLGGLALTLDGIRARDRCVIDHCLKRGIAVAGTLAGGYARHLEDTIAAHHGACRLMWEHAAMNLGSGAESQG